MNRKRYIGISNASQTGAANARSHEAREGTKKIIALAALKGLGYRYSPRRTLPIPWRGLPISYCATSSSRTTLRGLIITLNGDRFELAGAVTVSSLLAQLDIDPRRVAVEQNTIVLKRTAFDSTIVNEGDQIEIVNFVGGG